MEKLSDNLINYSTELQELSNFVTSFINDSELVSTIEKLTKVERSNDYEKNKEYLNNLYDALELMAFIIAEREDSSIKISESPYMKNIKLSVFFNKLDLIANDVYKMAKHNPELETKKEKAIRKTTKIDEVYDEFGVETSVFSKLNPEFLLQTEEIIDVLPKDATVVDIHVKNTKNLISIIKPIIDSDYVDAHFPLMSITSGVNAESIERFAILKEYKNTAKETTLVDDPNSNIYQRLEDGKYRKLIHYPENDHVRNYDYLPINAMITNFENKRITMLRQNIPKSQLYVEMKDEYMGRIKYNIAVKKKNVTSAIFDTLYRPDMTDEQVIKLGIGSFTLQKLLPDNEKELIEKFNNVLRRRDIQKLL